ncbi:MAG: HU family DNA-binding protein [Chloroflexi bacterium CFX4]|nr:HU family DNA-binding protein [Chloroflexi bacterium CFX4]MDL1921489.1 HU family DNA-binding protein [Chloroflexi bacterium CFX3]
MQKTDLIKRVAESANLTQADAAKAVNALIDIVTETLKSGEKVTITGFGTFEVRESAARTGTNPRTKEKITIAARKRPTFSPGSQLREAVSGKKA